MPGYAPESKSQIDIDMKRPDKIKPFVGGDFDSHSQWLYMVGHGEVHCCGPLTCDGDSSYR